MAKKAPSSTSPADGGKVVLKVQRSQEKGQSRNRSSWTARKNNKPKARVDDARKPKKPPSAFFYFLEDFRKEFQKQNPDIKTMQDIGKACGEKWNTMKYEDKVQYYDLATVKRAEFDKAMEKYNEWKESGKHKL